MSKSSSSSAVVQAAGHGLLRIDDHPDRLGAIIKPTSKQECVMYERMLEDSETMKRFQKFIPKYFASWSLDFVPLGSKFTHEVSLENLCRLVDEDVFRWSKEISLGEQEKDLKELVQEESSSSSSSKTKSSITKTKILFESSPCVLDLKIGRFRYTKATPLRKYMRQMRKDSPTTARSVGLRICGVRHNRFVMDSVLELLKMNNATETKSNDDDVVGVHPVLLPSSLLSPEEREKRKKRREEIRKRNEKIKKRADSDSEILQLPKAAAELLKKQQQQKEEEKVTKAENENKNEEEEEEELIDVLHWTEDKIIGRNISPAELLEFLAMFSTIQVSSDSSVGRHPLHEEDKSCEQRFDPYPEHCLLEFFKTKVEEMMKIIEEDKILNKYSFASASILFVHQWSIREEEETSKSYRKKYFLDVKADLRLVDFSSSGPVIVNKNNSSSASSSPSSSSPLNFASFATAIPESPISQQEQQEENENEEDNNNEENEHQLRKKFVPLFADEIVEFKFGLENLKTALNQLCVASEIFQKKLSLNNKNSN